jgi:hypothetical protein
MSVLVSGHTRPRARHGARSDAAADELAGGLPAQAESRRAGHEEARWPRPHAHSELPKTEDVPEDLLEAMHPVPTRGRARRGVLREGHRVRGHDRARRVPRDRQVAHQHLAELPPRCPIATASGWAAYRMRAKQSHAVPSRQSCYRAVCGRARVAHDGRPPVGRARTSSPVCKPMPLPMPNRRAVRDCELRCMPPTAEHEQEPEPNWSTRPIAAQEPTRRHRWSQTDHGKMILQNQWYGMVWYGMVPLLPPVSVFCH